MKVLAITLHQPWASLLANGQKVYETRAWETEYRGIIAVHAGKNEDSLDLRDQEPFWNALKDEPFPLPMGSIVGLVILTDCISTNERVSLGLDEPEASFGDFSADRFAWRMGAAVKLEAPIPTRGYQKLWEWEVPAEHEATILAAIEKLQVQCG